MIRLGIKICDCCEEEAETLYLYKHVDRYNRIYKQALCLECFKDKTEVYSEEKCEGCGGASEALYEVDGSVYCEDCLTDMIIAYDGREVEEV